MIQVARAAVTLVFVFLSGIALATGGGGIESRLLAFAGPSERYAIFVEQASGDSSPGDVKVYAVDTEATGFRRLWPYVWRRTEAEMEISDAKLYARFVKSLAPAKAALLAPRGRWMNEAGALPAGAVGPDGGRLPVWSARGHTIEARLKQLYTFDAMSKFERGGEEGGTASCSTWNEDPPCSTCKKVKVWADGEPKEIWQCRPARGTRKLGDDEERIECDCYGRGVAVSLELRDNGALSKSATASKVLVVPYELNGGFGASAGAPVPKLELTYDGSSLTVFAHVNASGTFVVSGFAVEEPQANAKHFPIVAIYRIPPAKTAVPGKEGGLATGAAGTRRASP